MYINRFTFGLKMMIALGGIGVGVLVLNYYILTVSVLLALFFFKPVIKGRNKIKWTNRSEFKAAAEDIIHSEIKQEALTSEPGIFKYVEGGFVMPVKDTVLTCSWNEIESILAYKRNNLVTDSICADLICKSGKRITVTEEMSGWWLFIRNMQLQFPSINPAWSIKIATPAFKPNYTLLYDRTNRELETVLAANKRDKVLL